MLLAIHTHASTRSNHLILPINGLADPDELALLLPPADAELLCGLHRQSLAGFVLGEDEGLAALLSRYAAT